MRFRNHIVPLTILYLNATKDFNSRCCWPTQKKRLQVAYIAEQKKMHSILLLKYCCNDEHRPVTQMYFYKSTKLKTNKTKTTNR